MCFYFVNVNLTLVSPSTFVTFGLQIGINIDIRRPHDVKGISVASLYLKNRVGFPIAWEKFYILMFSENPYPFLKDYSHLLLTCFCILFTHSCHHRRQVTWCLLSDLFSAFQSFSVLGLHTHTHTQVSKGSWKLSIIFFLFNFIHLKAR